jgi:hypothetical protein
LRVYYGSEISAVPNLIEGDSVQRTFSAGYYQAKGQPVPSAAAAAGDSIKSSITVRPLAPFSVSSSAWSKSMLFHDYNILHSFFHDGPCVCVTLNSYEVTNGANTRLVEQKRLAIVNVPRIVSQSK